MADPRNELADIIVPVAPAAVSGASVLPLWTMAAGLAAVICIVLLSWWWHRRRFARALKAISNAAAQQLGAPDAIAVRLDVWARSRFGLVRLEAAASPQGVDAEVWAAWVNSLARLRFAPASPDGWNDLAALCKTARQWSRHV